MLQVKTPEEFLELLKGEFSRSASREEVPVTEALGRILYEDILADQYVPDFDRSAMDGYAVKAADTFGCGTALPAILELKGQILMGEAPPCRVEAGQCLAIPTGGAMPEGADAVVMVEFTEDYGDGTVGIMKSAAPGSMVVFRGDDVYPGKKVLAAGKKLSSHDIGALAALGVVSVPVCGKLKAAVISTGDELVAPDETPGPGQVRNINSLLVCSQLTEFGMDAYDMGIIRDQEELLCAALSKAAAENDLVVISGGSSVGMRDATERSISKMGELLVHGIAVKPGKPTILGRIGGTPVVGLPGHPGAAFFITRQFVRPLVDILTGRDRHEYKVTATLTEKVSANHGRAQYTTVSLEQREDGLYAIPRRAKSSQITEMAAADGCFCIGRDREGVMAGEKVEVSLYNAD